MNEVLRLLGRQLNADLRQLPQTVSERLSTEHRLSRAGTIAELRAEARRSLPPVIFDFVDGAADDEVTSGRNRADFERLAIAPRALVDVSATTTATTVLGQEVAAPIIGAPTGLCGLVHHEGEAGLAKAMNGLGCAYTLAAMSSYSIEEVAAAAPGPLWFQIYLWRDRGLVAELLDRAAAAGMQTLVVTIDVPRSAARDRDRRNHFALPPRMTARTVAHSLRTPRWTWSAVGRPRFSAANVSLGASDAVSVAAYIDQQFDPSADWAYLGWMRERWSGKLLVKGVMRPEDAVAVVKAGADGVGVSNHGGRQLDHLDSAIGALPAVAAAVGDDAEVYIDGGFRRGSDILKALALGACGCLVGRPPLYGLGVGGEAGARRAVELLTNELRAAMVLSGVTGIDAIGPDLVAPRRPFDLPVEPVQTPKIGTDR